MSISLKISAVNLISFAFDRHVGGIRDQLNKLMKVSSLFTTTFDFDSIGIHFYRFAILTAEIDSNSVIF